MRKVVGLMGIVLVLGLLALLAGQWAQRSLLAAGVQQLNWQQLRWQAPGMARWAPYRAVAGR